jgi:hypothetical protein
LGMVTSLQVQASHRLQSSPITTAKRRHLNGNIHTRRLPQSSTTGSEQVQNITQVTFPLGHVTSMRQIHRSVPPRSATARLSHTTIVLHIPKLQTIRGRLEAMAQILDDYYRERRPPPHSPGRVDTLISQVMALVLLQIQRHTFLTHWRCNHDLRPYDSSLADSIETKVSPR